MTMRRRWRILSKVFDGRFNDTTCFSQLSSDVSKYDLAEHLEGTQTPAQQQTGPREDAEIDDRHIERDDRTLNFRVTESARGSWYLPASLGAEVEPVPRDYVHG